MPRQLPLRDSLAAPSLTASERVVYDDLVTREFEVCRGGWPDFLCISPDGGHIFAIEVKSGSDTLSRAQTYMTWWLQEAGITTLLVYVHDGQIIPFDRPAWYEGMREMRPNLTRAEAQALRFMVDSSA
jgi:hypothetical protein